MGGGCLGDVPLAGGGGGEGRIPMKGELPGAWGGRGGFALLSEGEACPVGEVAGSFSMFASISKGYRLVSQSFNARPP